jgi:hypothetical protein
MKVLQPGYRNSLAGVLLTSQLWAFWFKQRYPDVQVIHPLNPELSSWQRGAVTTEYFNAHQRTVRRLRRILARKEKCKSGAKSGMPCTTAT